MRTHETLDCQCGSNVDGTIAGTPATCSRAGAGTSRLCTTLPSLDLILAQRMIPKSGKRFSEKIMLKQKLECSQWAIGNRDDSERR